MFPFQPLWATELGGGGGVQRFLLCWVSLLSDVLWQWLAVFSVPQLLKTQIILLLKWEFPHASSLVESENVLCKCKSTFLSEKTLGNDGSVHLRIHADQLFWCLRDL